MAPISRRGFLLSSSASLFGAYAFGADAATIDPKLPPAPQPIGGSVAPSSPLPPLADPSEQNQKKLAALPPEERVGFALVGLGHLTLEEILPAFAASRLARPAALVSGDPKKAARVAAQYGLSKSSLYDYKNFDRIVDNKDVKVVYVVLPNSMHKEFVLRALAAGKDVLCEKPMATNSEDARAMVEAARKANRKLMIAYRQQYEPWNRLLREMIAKGTFGKLKIAEACNAQNQNAGAGVKQWRHVKALSGGGSLPDIGLYCLNGLRYLTNEEPVEVSAQTYSTPKDSRFKEVEETVLWQMRFPSGLLANCTTCYGAHNYKRLRFDAEHGGFGLNPAFVYRGMQGEITYPEGAFEMNTLPRLAEANQFANEMDHMADCVRENKLPMSPGEEGVQDHVIMEAIYKSAATRQPVGLKEYTKKDVFRHPESLV